MACRCSRSRRDARGARELGYALAERVAAHRAERASAEPTRIVLRPAAVDDAGFTVAADPEVHGGFLVPGAKPRRWVRQTDFDNDEAVGYLADRLARLGVEADWATRVRSPAPRYASAT